MAWNVPGPKPRRHDDLAHPAVVRVRHHVRLHVVLAALCDTRRVGNQLHVGDRGLDTEKRAGEIDVNDSLKCVDIVFGATSKNHPCTINQRSKYVKPRQHLVQKRASSCRT